MILSNLGATTNSVVHAAIKNNNAEVASKVTNNKIEKSSSVKLKSSVTLTKKEIEAADKYVKVRNNKYVLMKVNSSALSKKIINSVKFSIKKSNDIVEKNNLTINPTTKSTEEILPPQQDFDNSHFLILSRRRNNSHYTYKTFWWGTRYYFRSNAAVAEMDHDLSHKELLLDGVGALTTVVDGGSRCINNVCVFNFKENAE